MRYKRGVQGGLIIEFKVYGFLSREERLYRPVERGFEGANSFPGCILFHFINSHRNGQGMSPRASKQTIDGPSYRVFGRTLSDGAPSRRFSASGKHFPRSRRLPGKTRFLGPRGRSCSLRKFQPPSPMWTDRRGQSARRSMPRPTFWSRSSPGLRPMKRYGENGWIDFGRRLRAMIIPISINFQIDGGGTGRFSKNGVDLGQPKIADRILSSLSRLKIGVKSGIPRTRYQIQRFGSCPGIPSCFLSAILGPTRSLTSDHAAIYHL